MELKTWMILLLIILSLGCDVQRVRVASPAAAASVHAILLPEAPKEGVFMDYLAYDRAHHRVWVPAGNTGSVDVVDTITQSVVQIKGFPTAQVERNGIRRTVGPSSATVGKGVVYVGNRGNASVCAVDAESLHIERCVTLASMPDALAYVASTREVWVTTPRDRSIVVLDAGTPATVTQKATIRMEGQPEGFAVDEMHGIFYANLEDRDRTLAIAIDSRQVRSTWRPDCGEGGPKGLAVDKSLGFLFVACPDHVVVLDAAHDGKRLSTMAVGPGIDNIDYVESRRELYVAAARAATLTVARVDRRRGLTDVVTMATVPGARNALATEGGTVYLTDSAEGKILVVVPPAFP
jgi:DNA-binding beta-propeller fold protein YncE